MWACCSACRSDLQPNYDGLSFDETLLAVIPSVAVVFLVRRMVRRRRTPSATRAGSSPPAPRPT